MARSVQSRRQPPSRRNGAVTFQERDWHGGELALGTLCPAPGAARTAPMRSA
ncbi:MAG TPA: hypothetical protein VMA37_19120 [Acetobacteraceae bacterium]|nr:hypothetical protein [Acetobacteraceae bacterium]